MNHLITEGKVYSNEDITLKNLSQELSTNEVLLSQIIDDIYSCTFFEFINECRIKEAQKILLNPEFKMKTIKNIASRIGFSTKAEFVDEFQKIVGVTPAIFLKMKNLS
ncbi:MAG: AraC family transcriptional regulator [Bacteroidetes bacterium]|nr:AraC family transcriptional regulator [Bacteroidota bacterium]